jgi:hypothetical protein
VRVRLPPAAARCLAPRCPAVRRQRQGSRSKTFAQASPAGAGPGGSSIDSPGRPARPRRRDRRDHRAPEPLSGSRAGSGPPTPSTGTTESGPRAGSRGSAARRPGRRRKQGPGGLRSGCVDGGRPTRGGTRALAAVRRHRRAKVYPQIAVRNGWEGGPGGDASRGDGVSPAVRLLGVRVTRCSTSDDHRGAPGLAVPAGRPRPDRPRRVPPRALAAQKSC